MDTWQPPGPLAALSSFHWGNLLIFPSPAVLRPWHVPWRAAALQRGVGCLLSLYFMGYWANAGGGRAAGLCHLCVPPGSSASPSLPRTKSLGFFLVFFNIIFFFVGEGRIINEFGAVTMGTCC